MFALLKTLLFLIFVILLIYACFYFAKKRALSSSGSRLKLIEHKRLDQKFSLMLVSVDDNEMIVVTGPQGATIKKISTSLSSSGPFTSSISLLSSSAPLSSSGLTRGPLHSDKPSI